MVFFIGWLFVCLMSLADLVLTIRLYKLDLLDEMNPIADWLFSYGVMPVIFFKIITFSIASIALWMLYFRNTKIASITLLIVFSILCLVMLQHARILALTRTL